MPKCKIISGGAAYDDRGSLKYFNDFDAASLGIKRFYVVSNNSACDTRAWHGHFHEGKYCTVIAGSAIIVAIPIEGRFSGGVELGSDIDMERFVLSANQPRMLYIPPGMFNGARTLEPGTQIMYFSTSTLEESKNDDIRVEFSEDFNPFKVEVR
jgi:dTDP-4-dehydrorhamnose 3,5-epimerase-like enzyme